MTEPTSVTQTETMEHTDAPTGPLGTLGINGPLFAAQLLNVAIIILVLRAWVFKPLGTMLEERRKKIEQGLTNAAEAEQRLSSAKEKEDALVAEARAEARKIVDDARASGEQERQKRVAEAAHDIETQVKDAKTKIQMERTNALEAVRKEVAGLVLAATKKVSMTGVDEKKEREAIDQALQELEKTSV